MQKKSRLERVVKYVSQNMSVYRKTNIAFFKKHKGAIKKIFQLNNGRGKTYYVRRVAKKYINLIEIFFQIKS